MALPTIFHAVGVVDSSGVTFTYINERREHNAGVLLVGHTVGLNQIVPPGLSNYTVSGVCPMSCTNRVSIITYSCCMYMARLVVNL